MVNLHVGVVASERYVAAWSWPERGLREGAQVDPFAVLLDRATLRILGPLEGVRPVIWVGPDRFLGLRRSGNAWSYALFSVRTAPPGVELTTLRTFDEPKLSGVSRPSFPVLLPAPRGERPRVLVVRNGLHVVWFDLDSGEWKRVRDERQPWKPWLSAYSGIRLLGSRAWFVSLSDAWRVVGLRDAIRGSGGDYLLERTPVPPPVRQRSGGSTPPQEAFVASIWARCR